MRVHKKGDEDQVYPSWTGFDTFNLDLRKTLPSLNEKAPVKFEQNIYYRNLMKFMSTRKVKFNYQVLMDIYVVGTIALFSLAGERYALKEIDFLLEMAEFVWVFRSIRTILRIASELTRLKSDCESIRNRFWSLKSIATVDKVNGLNHPWCYKRFNLVTLAQGFFTILLSYSFKSNKKIWPVQKRTI